MGALASGLLTNLNWALERTAPKQASRQFACQTELLSMQQWLGDDDARVTKALAVCIDDLAAQIQTALEEPATAPDAGAVGLGPTDLATGNW